MPNKSVTLFALIAFLSVISTIGLADGFKSGNDLLRKCTEDGSYDDIDRGSFCYGYVDAIVDVLAGGNSIANHTACFPDGITARQVRDVVTQYLSRNPAIRHQGASVLSAAAISGAFPCKR